ncbi:MAG: ABC transporter ATP-binding protein [Myxococcota bacterium]|nr:ABC transporter ATP-binding protein [Myxococcota bacterium]
MALIEIRGLVKRFGDETVLDGVDLDVNARELLTLIGPSGCGKSVLLKCLIGLIRPDAGSIVFDGEELTKLPEPEWVRVRKRIGMLFQEGALFDSLSVEDNVAYGLREHRLLPEPEIAERVSEALAQVSLPGIEKMWPSSLSGGMRKRVALARAFAMHPDVVLYDEPTEGLDPINVTRVNRLLDRLRTEQGVTTVVVTHNMQSAFGVSERLAFLHGGKIVLEGPPAQLKASGDARLAPFVRASELSAKTRPSTPGLQ